MFTDASLPFSHTETESKGVSMNLANSSAAVTGGASGLGRATAEAFITRGVPTVIINLPTSNGDVVTKELGELATFMPADVRDADADADDAALAEAEKSAPLRAVVHCAGRSHIPPDSVTPRSTRNWPWPSSTTP
jgi:NAD(P)-dependent dehydrogenase (short-subunit alcohol dehydrogenase family)